MILAARELEKLPQKHSSFLQFNIPLLPLTANQTSTSQDLEHVQLPRPRAQTWILRILLTSNQITPRQRNFETLRPPLRQPPPPSRQLPTPTGIRRRYPRQRRIH